MPCGSPRRFSSSSTMGPWRNRSPKSLKKSSNPPGVYTSMMRAGSGPAFHMVWRIRRGFSTQLPGVALTTIADPSLHLPLEYVEPDIVLVHVWRYEKTRLERLLDDQDDPVG